MASDCVLACSMAKAGMHGCALATVVGFHTLLRVDELVGIRVGDVSIPVDPRRGLHVHSAPTGVAVDAPPARTLIRLPITKTGPNQWVEVYDTQVGSIVSRLVSNRPKQDFLFTFHCTTSVRTRADYYRRILSDTTTACGLAHCHYTPHSLRHGGATHANRILGQNIDTIMHRGRWKSNESCRAYIQSGAALLLEQDLPPAAVDLADYAHQHWYVLLLRHCFTGVGPPQSS